MQGQTWVVRTGLGSLVAAATCAVALVTAGPATALVSFVPPAPLTMPGSVVASLAGSGGGAVAVAGLEASGGTVVGSSAVLAGGVSAGALLGTTAAGLAIGTYLGQQTLSVLPSDWYSTSGSTLCDVQLVVDAAASCATGAALGYVYNSDLGPIHPPGWTAVPEYFSAYRDLYSIHDSVQVNGDTWPNVSATVNAEVWVPGTRLSGQTMNVVCVYASDGVTIASGSLLGGPSYFDAGVSSYSFGCPSGTVLDHIELWVGSKVTGMDYVVVGEDVKAYWYPTGNVLRPPDALSNPSRHWRTAWECSDGTSGVKVSAMFHETDASWPTLPVASCATGAVTHTLTTKITEGLTATPTIAEWTAPPGYTDWAAANPGCVNGSCTLTLSRIDATSATTLSCFSNPTLCVNWWDSPTKTSDYVCTYGADQVALSECDVYRPTFNVATGAAVKDKTGTVVPDPASYGDPTDQGNPIPDPTGTPAPVQNPAQDNSCPPPFSWTAMFNNWWAFKATSCALSEAFVPKTLPTQVQALVTTVQTRAPFPQLESVFTWFAPPPAGSGCLVYGVTFPAPIGHISILDSCDPNDPIVRAIAPLRGLLGVAIWAATLAPLAWWAWRQYAPGSQGVA